jgi:hypothetical protein
VLKNAAAYRRRRLVVATLAGLAGFAIVCVAMEPFDVPWLYGAALGSAAAVAHVLAGGRSVGEAALASAIGSLLVVVAVLVYVFAGADDLSLVELAFALTYVVWWVLGIALVVLVGPALICSTLVVAASRAVRTTVPWHRIDLT